MKRIFLILFMSVILCGCSSKETTDASLEELELEIEIEIPEIIIDREIVEESAPEPVEDLTGKAVSPLTGNYIDEEETKRRPVAVVINNLKKALPQSGIRQASLYYEVLAEGNITRIIAIFQDFDSAKIGPIRSTRHYFADFVLDHDAIFTHFGGSDQGKQAIVNYKISNLDGLRLDGGAIWRDSERIKISGMYEHSAYSSAANLLNAAETTYRYRMERGEFEPMFDFYQEFTIPDDSEKANNVTVEFMAGNNNLFEYDEESQLYKKSQNGDKHIDEETGEQLAVSNVLIQETVHQSIANDTAGRIDVKLVGSGRGYLITAGTYTPIKWSKSDHYSPTVWTYEDGTKIKLNKGKTWINVVKESGLTKFEG